MMAAERFMLSRSRCLSLWQQACVLDDALGLDPILPEEPRELLGRVEDGLKPARDQVLVAEGRLVRDTLELSIPIAAALVEEGGAGCVTSSPRPVSSLPADSRRR
jgi:hypothetical protein